MSSSRFHEAIRDLDELTVKQRRFLGRIAYRIPQLIKVIVSGKSESRCDLGRRQLKDGRKLQLELVARAPKKDADSPLGKWGSGVAKYPDEREEGKQIFKKSRSG